MPERVIVFIDGYNLHYGLRDAELLSSRWLDIVALSESLLKSDQQLIMVRYFTTRVRNNPDRAARQAIFLDALLARGRVAIDYGHFLSTTTTCNRCGKSWQKHEEKKTDVNIAVRLLEDAYDDRYDCAIVVSGDSDLAPPIRAVRARFTEKRAVRAEHRVYPVPRASREP